MRHLFILLLLFWSLNIYSFEQSNNQHFIQLEMGSSSSNPLFTDEGTSSYPHYSIKYYRQFILTSSLSIKMGGGYFNENGMFKYKPGYSYKNYPILIAAYTVNISPTLNISDNFEVSPTFQGFCNPVKISETEIATSKIGIELNYRVSPGIKIGGFHDQTMGTTKRQLTTNGISLHIGF